MDISIDEAIKVLEEERKNHHSFSTDLIGKAEALGIEALKGIKKLRKTLEPYVTALLPGEKEE